MLTPDYYESCVDDILNLYAQLEDDIISDVIRRMMKTGFVTESAKHQAEMLQNAGLLYDDILAEISKYTDASSAQVKALFEDAGVRTVNFDNQIYRAVGLVPVDIRQSPAMRQTLEAGYRKTLGNMRNLTLTTANMGQTTYYNACNQAYMKVISGAFSYQEAIKKAVQKTAQDGAFVLYPSGHRDRVDVAVRRSVLTGVGQTCREIGIMNAEENDCDLMELSAHFGARPTHAEWQGQIVSLSGRKGYLSLSDIGYGTGDGFGGWNCRHDWFPYFEGYSRRNYTDSYLKSLNEKNIEYNGEKYSQYEISQIQRKYEREIRSAKREKVAFDTAVKGTSDSELKSVMKSGSDYANQQIKEKQAQMRDFIQQTGNKRDYFREQNYGKVIYTKNSGNPLTFGSNNGKIKSANKLGIKEIQGEHSREYDLKATNPKFITGDEKYKNNCQKCVCTYEARRRGYDVTANPTSPNSNENITTMDLNKGLPSAFKNTNVMNITGFTGKSVRKNIENKMSEWGNGSRAIVGVHWKSDGMGHVFIAEQFNGKTLFIDPQSNQSDVSYYFKGIKTSLKENDYTYFFRIDNLEFTDKIKKCFTEVKKK